MSGRPGRSGGWNKLSVEQHLLRGTYNATRHGPRPGSLAAATVRYPTETVLPADVLEGLSGRGAAFAAACWAEYTGWSSADLMVLHECGRLIDELEQLRGQQGERAAQRLLLSALSSLRLA